MSGPQIHLIDSNPQAQDSLYFSWASDGLQERILSTVCCPLPSDAFAYVGVAFYETTRFSFQGSRVNWKVLCLAHNVGRGVSNLLSLEGRGGLRPNKGNHFKLDELRDGRLLEALEKSQKVDFLLFNIDVWPACKSWLDLCAPGGHWPWRLLLLAGECPPAPFPGVEPMLRP